MAGIIGQKEREQEEGKGKQYKYKLYPAFLLRGWIAIINTLVEKYIRSAINRALLEIPHYP